MAIIGQVILVSISEAKAKLPALLDAVQSGESVVITKAGKPVARLIRYDEVKTPRQPGALKGRIEIAEDFDELPSEFLGFP